MFAEHGVEMPMSQQADITMDEKRQKLLKAKLGDLLTWTKPELVETIGPFEPSVFEEFDARRRKLILECTEALQGRSEEEIAVLVAKATDETEEAKDRWRRLLGDEIKSLSRRTPPWYAGGFGHPDHIADFEYWSKMNLLTLHEILCLSVGVEPGSVDPTLIERLAHLSREDLSRRWPTSQFLVWRREQLRRQFSLGRSERRVSPESFVFWVERVAFEAHPEFLRLLRLYHVEGADRRVRAAATGREDPREIDKIAQLFTAMAIDQLGYDPKQARSPIPREIADLAASKGLEVSDDTVRKYLKIGASFIAKNWKPE